MERSEGNDSGTENKTVLSYFMRNLKPEQQDTGTRLATPFRRRPFSAGGRK